MEVQLRLFTYDSGYISFAVCTGLESKVVFLSGEFAVRSIVLFLVDNISSEFDSQSIQMFHIEVVKVNIVRIITIIHSIFSLPLNSFNDLDHNKSHMNISFFFIAMLDFHKLSQ